MQRDCPKGQGGGKGAPQGYPANGWGKGNIRSLHFLEEVTPDEVQVKLQVKSDSCNVDLANMDNSVSVDNARNDFDDEVLDWIIEESDDTRALHAELDKMELAPPDTEENWQNVISKSAARRDRKKARLMPFDCAGSAECSDSCCQLNILEKIEAEEEIMAIGEWEELCYAVDSGATETVVSSEHVKSVPTVKGKSGIQYRTANGDIVENEGEKHMVICSNEGVNRSITAQVTEVTKPLLSVSKMVNAGNTVVFSKDNSYIYDEMTGEVMNLEEKNGMFLLKLWTKPQSGF